MRSTYIRGRELWIAIVRFWFAIEVTVIPRCRTTEMMVVAGSSPALAGKPMLSGLIGL